VLPLIVVAASDDSGQGRRLAADRCGTNSWRSFGTATTVTTTSWAATQSRSQGCYRRCRHPPAPLRRLSPGPTRKPAPRRSELTNRAVEQAWLFGAKFLLAGQVVGIDIEGRLRRVRLISGASILARAVVIACGVSWRRSGVPALEALLGAGVFYGAASSEQPRYTARRSSSSAAGTPPARRPCTWLGMQLE
jgi:hypothetical protein